jgi:hypothetical protein
VGVTLLLADVNGPAMLEFTALTRNTYEPDTSPVKVTLVEVEAARLNVVQDEPELLLYSMV